jgi:hypothetical protein
MPAALLSKNPVARFKMKRSKPRNTLAKQIINLAKADDLPSNERAMFIARHGRPFLNEEQELLDFYTVGQ